jgi:DNA-binding IclR family transcriptional regulator
MTWGASAFSSIEVRAVAEPVMLRLCSDTRESVSLWIRDGSRRICIATHDSPQPVRHVIQIGEQLPLTRGSGGKLTLALMPEPEALAVIHADSGLGDERRAQLIAELPGVRERGYGTSIQQMTANAWSMAAAIFDSRAREEPAATLVIAGPTGRLRADTIEGFAELLLPAAREVSKAMGAAGNAAAGPALHGGSPRP